MNVKPVTNANAYVSRIKVVGEVDDYVRIMLDNFDGRIQNLAERYNKTVKVAQRKDQGVNAIYVNSGDKTSRIDLKQISNGEDIYRGIENNIRANGDKSFSILV